MKPNGLHLVEGADAQQLGLMRDFHWVPELPQELKPVVMAVLAVAIVIYLVRRGR